MSNVAVSSGNKLAACGGKPVRTQPFHSWPVFGQEEETALLEVFRSGKWWYGEKVQEFEKKYAEFHGANHGITCCNGTVSIELSLTAMGIGLGDEVLVPAYTFIATCTAVVNTGATPVFVDVEPDTVNIDLKKAEQAITPKTKALVVVHFAGLPVNMDDARALAKKHNLRLFEDAAHGWGSQWKGKGVGAIGDMGSFSFQMSKNITSGEGGIILTDSKELEEIVRSLSNCGRREGGAWYEHYRVGGNYRLTELQAAILIAQLTRLEAQTLKRQENARILNTELSKIPGITVQPQDERVTRRSYHLYCIRYEASQFGGLPRDKFVKALQAEGIPCSTGYVIPTYKNPCFQMMGDKYKSVFCPVAEKLCSEEEIWLPHAMLLGPEQDMRDVVTAFQKVHEHQKELM